MLLLIADMEKVKTLAQRYHKREKISIAKCCSLGDEKDLLFNVSFWICLANVDPAL